MIQYLRAGILITAQGATVVTLRDQLITYEEGRILAVEDATDERMSRISRPETVSDARRQVVIPGLINTHHHLYQSLTRCMPGAQNLALFDWLRYLYTQWDKIDYAAVKCAAKISIAELLLSGCTATSDHFYLFPPETDVRAEAVLEAAEELGIRIHLCRGSMTMGKSAGGLPPDSLVEREDAVLRDYVRVVERFHDSSAYSLRRIDLAPCSPFNVSRGFLADTRDFARERGLLLHTHAAETRDEEDYCVEKYGCRPIEFLADLNWLGEDVYLAHCVQLKKNDIEALAKSATSVAHCPCSNMRLASGVAPIRRMLDAGVNVGIGVDGGSSNDGGHLMLEARQAMLLQRVSGQPEGLLAVEAFRMATLGGAKCLNRAKLGCIAPGMAADFAMFRTDSPELAGAVVHDPLAALVFCPTGRADRVVIAGRDVVLDGRLALADEHQLADELNRLAARRFGRIS